MLTTDYAKATYQAIEEGLSVQKAFAQLDVLLKKKGHTKLKAGILRALLSHTNRQQTSDAPTVTLAREKFWDKYRHEVARALEGLGVEGKPTIVEDTNIVGGYRVEYKDKLLDNTYKDKLLALYRKVIT